MHIIPDHAEQVARYRKLLTKHNNSADFVIGFISTGVRLAAETHPGDRELADIAAMIEAFHENQGAAIDAYRAQQGGTR